MNLPPEKWEEVKELFEVALEQSPEQRATFLGEACRGDTVVLENVKRLLAEHDEMGEFLERPVITVATAKPRELHTFATGDVVSGRFRIVRFIGQGGMGQVYEAEDLELGGGVALKTIRPEIAADARTIARFKQEIKLSKKVTHPNVCRIFDVARHRKSGRDPGAPTEPGGPADFADDVTYLTMELLQGETLAGRLHRAGRMTAAEAFPVVAQIADGLEAAHRTGIIHRDLKSSNVVLVPLEGGGFRAVVTDFGLALASSGADDPSGGASAGYTGTPGYMAPEQVRGGDITTATDIYSLGVVMYEMVTGALPFVGDTPTATAVKRLEQAAPSPRSIVPDLDATWETVILRCLDRDPLHRFGTALEITRALRPHAFLQVWRHRRGSILGAAAAALLFVLSVVGYRAYLASRPERKSELARSLLQEGLAKQEKGERKAAEAAFEKARNLYASAGNRAGVTEALIDTGDLLRQMGEPARAKSAYESALAISRETDAQQLVGTLMLKIGNALHLQGDLGGARRSYESALAIFREVNDQRGVAVIFKDLGNIELDPDQAQKHYEQALAVFKQIGDKRGAASALDDIGNVLDLQGYLGGARKVFEEELSMWHEIGDRGWSGIAMGNLGDVLCEQGALSEAGRQFEESLRIIRQLIHPRLPWALQNVGELFFKEGQFSEARKTFEESLAVGYELGNKDDIGQARLWLARLSLAENRPAEAETQARQAEDQFRRPDKTRALVVLAQALARQGKLREARDMVKGRVLPAMKHDPPYSYGDRLFVMIIAGRVLAAGGNNTAGAKYLESALADASRLGYLGYQLEARLALGEIAMKAGRLTEGHAALKALEGDAAAKGFGSIVNEAASILADAERQASRK
jgi:tetratricopeptide (TPR) repeat protein